METQASSELGKVESFDLYVPPLLQASEFFQEELSKHFKEVTVRVTSCPDLRKDPYNLVSSGLGGNPFILQIGGVKNAFPLPKKDKLYDLCAYAEAFHLPTLTLFGSAGGPLGKLGCNAETAVNFRIGETRAGKTVVCHNYVSSWHKDGSRECRIIEKPRISYLGDLFASQGLPGRVMYFKLRSRTSEKAADLLGLIRDLLLEHFGPTRPIGMGGVILIKRGRAKLHIMKRDFPDGPLETKDIYTAFDAPAPLVGLATVVSTDAGIHLNQTHMHTFSQNGHGGHFHEDASADSIEYEAYFSFATRAIHFDTPQ